jgi:hypothetical protein
MMLALAPLPVPMACTRSLALVRPLLKGRLIQLELGMDPFSTTV